MFIKIKFLFFSLLFFISTVFCGCGSESNFANNAITNDSNSCESSGLQTFSVDSPNYLTETINTNEKIRYLYKIDLADRRTLLLVIDYYPAQATQKVVFRKSFNSNELKQLNADYTFYHNQQDFNSLDQINELFVAKPLWKVKRNYWTLDDEDEFSEWVNQEVNTDFLQNSGLDVDCADLAFALRWIFARNNKLPMATSLAGSGRLFGHWASLGSWNRLPSAEDWKKDERFKQALRYVLNNTFTHSLIHDLYPVAINPQWVKPGTINLNLYSNTTGHTQILKTLSNYGLTVLWANTPASNDIFHSFIWLNPLSAAKGGFLKFRWPHKTNTGWQLIAGNAMPGYSLEQYEWQNIGTVNFQNLVLDRLNLGVNQVEQLIAEAKVLADYLKIRMQIVAEGFFRCSVISCAPNTKAYDDYSTPTRDRRIRETQEWFLSKLKSVSEYDSNWIAARKEWQKKLYPGSEYSLYDLMLNKEWVAGFDSDPRNNFSKRWGLNLTQRQDYLAGLMFQWVLNWNTRAAKVQQAQNLCFPHQEPNPVCNAQTTTIQNLFTTLEDRALKKWGSEIIKLFNDLNAGEKNQILTIAQAMPLATLNTCSANPCSLCNIGDFILKPTANTPSPLSKMTDKPTDKLLKRLGLY